MSTKKACARSQAARIIKSLLIDGQSLNTLLPKYCDKLEAGEQSLCKAICFGVVRHFFSLEETVSTHLKKDIRNKDYDVLALLFIGAYQLNHMRLPDYAAINSCVDASNNLGKSWAKGVINAVLRNIQRQGLVANEDEAKHEHPAWLIGKVRKAWPEQAEAIFAANNQQAPFCLRVNAAQGSRQSFSAQLSKESIEHHLGTFSNDAIYLDDKPSNIAELVGFTEGLFSVQDEAPQLCCNLLEARDEQRVLDACAAPGGKTCHLLEHAPNLQVLAVDIDSERLERVQQNLDRLKLNAQTHSGDISNTDDWYDGQAFDRILADVPCSATGVIRRHPDIKLLREGDDIKPLVALQQEILQKLWPLLKPGGILLYATCSILPEENSKQIKQFLTTQDDAIEMPINLDAGFATEHGWQMLPQQDSHDGFFYAKLQKSETANVHKGK